MSTYNSIVNDYDRINITNNIHIRIFNKKYVTHWFTEENDRIVIPISNNCDNWKIQFQGSEPINFKQYSPIIVEKNIKHRIDLSQSNSDESFFMLKLVVIKNYDEMFFDYIKNQIQNLK